MVGKYRSIGTDLVRLAPLAESFGQLRWDRNFTFFTSFAMQAEDSTAEVLTVKLKQLRNTGSGIIERRKEQVIPLPRP